jgi:hypothetical protein
MCGECWKPMTYVLGGEARQQHAGRHDDPSRLHQFLIGGLDKSLTLKEVNAMK